MSSKRYIVTAEYVEREPDGVRYDDGSDIFRTIIHRSTWSVEPNETFGDVMKKVNETYPFRVTITNDRSEPTPY